MYKMSNIRMLLIIHKEPITEYNRYKQKISYDSFWLLPKAFFML